MIERVLDALPELDFRRNPQGRGPMVMGAWLMLVLVLAVMFLPTMHMMVAMLALFLSGYTLFRPGVAIFGIFAVRGVLDLMWWIPGSFMGLNMLELFSGSVAALMGLLFLMEIKEMEKHRLFKYVAVFGALMVFARLRAYRPSGLSVDDLLVEYLSPFLIMFLVSVHIGSSRRARSLVILLTWLGAIAVALAFYHLSQGQMNTYTLHGYNRLLGGYKNLHNHSLMLMLFASLSVLLMSHDRSLLKRLVLGGLLAGSLAALYLTYVRTGLLGFAAFVAVFFYLSGRKGALLVALAALMVLLTVNTALQDRFSDLIYMFSEDPYVNRHKLGSGRWGIWTFSMREYLSQPPWEILMGGGLGGHWKMVDPWTMSYQAAKRYLDPHNDWLLLLYQVGPLGLAAYVGAIVVSIKTALKVRRLTTDPWVYMFCGYIVAMAVAMVVMNSVSNSFVSRLSPAWFFWGLVGMVFAEEHKLRRAREVPPGSPEGALASPPTT